MSNLKKTALWSKSFAPSLLAAIFLSLTTAWPLAQGVGAGRDLGGSGGTHIIQGHIYFPTKPPEGTRIRVRLQEPNTGDLSTVTDQDFTFRFSNLNAGYYVMTVDAGEQYEVFRESIAIDKETSRVARVITVPVYLQPKGSPPLPKPALIDAAAIGDAPKVAVDFYLKARESASRNDHEKAVEQLRKALDVYPQFALALNELGVQYLLLGRAQEAAEALQSALQLKPEEFTPRLNYGIALLNQKRFKDAEEQLRLALKKNDAAPTAHMYLGVALMSQHKLDEAEAELQRAVRSNSSEVAVAHRYLGGIYWGQREYRRAADELETYLKLIPKAPDAGRTRDAIKQLRAKQE